MTRPPASTLLLLAVVAGTGLSCLTTLALWDGCAGQLGAAS